MIAKSQRILGLDIGSCGVKAVEVARNGEKFTVTGFAEAEIASSGTLKDAIGAVVREGRFKSKQVISSVSGRSVIVRYINTPQMKTADLKASMKFEADKYIPFEVNEVILDCIPLEEKPAAQTGEMRVVLVAVKREVVNEHVRVLQEMGLYPYIIDVDCFALGNAFEFGAQARAAAEGADGANGKGAAYALIDIGAQKTNINIFKGGNSHFTREVYVGGEDLTEAVSKHLGVSTPEAEGIKRGGQRESVVLEAVSQTLDDLSNEIYLSFDYFENQFDAKIEKVFLSGGGSMLKGLPGVASQTLSRPVTAWNPLDGFDIDLPDAQAVKLRTKAPQMAIAMGLASRLRKV